MAKLEVRLERLKHTRAVCFRASGDASEEKALSTLLNWAVSKGLMQESGHRLFGRNTYPTDQPEPRGYECYLTIDDNFDLENTIQEKALPGGLFAVHRFSNLFNMPTAWMNLMSWVRENNHEPKGVVKDEHGWVNSGFEEFLSWQEQKPPTEWVFDIWLQIKE